MTKELRRLSILMLIMFLALFGSTSWIQVINASELSENPRNTRALYDSFEVQRGSIIASGAAIASSVPSDDVYSWQRVYTDPDMWAPVTGYINPAPIPDAGSPRSANRSRTVRTVNSSGRHPGTSSQSSGVDTRASGRGRIE